MEEFPVLASPRLPEGDEAGNAGGVRIAAVVLGLATLGQAPLQCGGEPDYSLRQHETPGEALYGLAEQFKAEGDEAAWRKTLERLIERYPNSRFAARAKLDLQKAAGEPGPGQDEPVEEAP